MKKAKKKRPAEYFFRDKDGNESKMHVDFFSNPPSTSKNPKRIIIVHDDSEGSGKPFWEELQEAIAASELSGGKH